MFEPTKSRKLRESLVLFSTVFIIFGVSSCGETDETVVVRLTSFLVIVAFNKDLSVCIYSSNGIDFRRIASSDVVSDSSLTSLVDAPGTPSLSSWEIGDFDSFPLLPLKGEFIITALFCSGASLLVDSII